MDGRQRTSGCRCSEEIIRQANKIKPRTAGLFVFIRSGNYLLRRFPRTWDNCQAGRNSLRKSWNLPPQSRLHLLLNKSFPLVLYNNCSRYKDRYSRNSNKAKSWMFHCQYLHRRMTKNQGTHIQPNNIRYGNRRNRNRNHCRRNRGSGRFRSKCCNENCPRNKRFLRSIASFRRSHNNRDTGRSSRRPNILRLNRSNRLKRPQSRRIRRSCNRSRDFPCRLCKKNRKGMFCRLCTRSDMKFRQSRLPCRRVDGLRHILQNRRSYRGIVRKDKRGGNMK